MLILSRVCAEFHNKSGEPVFTVTPRTRLTFQEAPEAIREDPLFDMLLHDRSIEVTENGARRKQLENDPETPAAEAPAAPGADAVRNKRPQRGGAAPAEAAKA